MKPSEPRAGDDKLTKDTALMAAAMVTKMKLQHKAIMVSFDPRKVHQVKTHYPSITAGTLFTTWYADVLEKPTQVISFLFREDFHSSIKFHVREN